MRGAWASRQIVQRLDQLWRQVQGLSRATDPDQSPALRERLTLIAQIDDRYSWIGLADVGGKVQVSSNGMLEGEAVSQRPWFQKALTAPFAGDVHEAVLLGRLLPKRDVPYRFIDFSAPVRDASGMVTDVLGAHFDWVWIMRLVDGFRSGEEDVILLSANRTVLHGPPEIYGKTLDEPTSATDGPVGKAGIVEWPDGRFYVTQTVPILTEGRRANLRLVACDPQRRRAAG